MVNMIIDIEQRVSSARELFYKGYNCTQSVTLAYADLFDVDQSVISRASISFGGGFGRQREVCGAVSGAGIVLGLLMPDDMDQIREAKKISYENVQLFSDNFRKENGSIVCRELLSLGQGEESTPTPAERTAEYYKRRPCVEYVASTVRIIGEMINNNDLQINKAE